jgi:hypothetical protein
MNYNLYYPIADALQLDIKLYSYGNQFELRGEREFKLPLSKNSDLQIKTKIEASVVVEDSAGVLVRIGKQFWAFVICQMFPDAVSTLTMHYLKVPQASIAPLKKAIAGDAFEEAMMAVKPLIHRTYTKPINMIEWFDTTQPIPSKVTRTIKAPKAAAM